MGTMTYGGWVMFGAKATGASVVVHGNNWNPWHQSGVQENGTIESVFSVVLQCMETCIESFGSGMLV